MAKKKVYLLNPGGVKKMSQKDLNQMAGIGLSRNLGKKKKTSKKRQSVSSNIGGKSMAKRKTRKSSRKSSTRKKRKSAKRPTRRKSVRKNTKTRTRKNVKRNARKSVRKNVRKKSVRKKARKKAVRKPAKRKARKTTRKKSVRRKARKTVRKNVKRKARRKTRRKTRKNTASKARRNPAKRNVRRRRPTLRRRRRLARLNSPFLIRPNALGPKSASKVGWRNRKRKRKGYAAPKMRSGRYPVMRNPRNLMSNLQTNLKALIHPAVLADAAQMTIGSAGSPIAAAYMATAIGKIIKKDIPLTGPVGVVVVASSGAVLATAVTAITGKPAIGKNIIYGTIAGLFAGAIKKQLLPRIPGAQSVAAITAAPAGVSGLYEDVNYDAQHGGGLGAYATAAEIQNASNEQF